MMMMIFEKDNNFERINEKTKIFSPYQALYKWEVCFSIISRKLFTILIILIIIMLDLDRGRSETFFISIGRPKCEGAV